MRRLPQLRITRFPLTLRRLILWDLRRHGSAPQQGCCTRQRPVCAVQALWEVKRGRTRHALAASRALLAELGHSKPSLRGLWPVVALLLWMALTRHHRVTRPVGPEAHTCPQPATTAIPGHGLHALVKEAEVVYHPSHHRQPSPAWQSERSSGTWYHPSCQGGSWYVCEHSRATRWVRPE
jgi:hypothetical protein